MNTPDFIYIAGKKVRIVIDSDYCSIHHVYGECHYGDNKIIISKISDSFSQDLQYQTLVHEIIHFINGILRRNETDIDREDYVNPLSGLLYQVLKQINLKEAA
jgi:hypothetical protein